MCMINGEGTQSTYGPYVHLPPPLTIGCLPGFNHISFRIKQHLGEYFLNFCRKVTLLRPFEEAIFFPLIFLCAVWECAVVRSCSGAGGSAEDPVWGCVTGCCLCLVCWIFYAALQATAFRGHMEAFSQKTESMYLAYSNWLIVPQERFSGISYPVCNILRFSTLQNTITLLL